MVKIGPMDCTAPSIRSEYSLTRQPGNCHSLGRGVLVSINWPSLMMWRNRSASCSGNVGLGLAIKNQDVGKIIGFDAARSPSSLSARVPCSVALLIAAGRHSDSTNLKLAVVTVRRQTEAALAAVASGTPASKAARRVPTLSVISARKTFKVHRNRLRHQSLPSWLER